MCTLLNNTVVKPRLGTVNVVIGLSLCSSRLTNLSFIQMELKKAKKRADSFSLKYQSLKRYLSDLDGRMGGDMPIHSNSGEVKHHLEDHKVHE